ncbi:GMC oxidoreductase [Tardiphaga sp. vice278]|uniref:GMC oxidoreductase n=1 Tax=Tardiphaga sp. vice278 TaxID=2592815 RepID=UPI001163A22E|nr:GMC oxidoreductase [Tardiphaga sp. vice278]QDM17955.1 GMC family oxidoreductase [Tardiphaga sp. vice278]
MTYDVVIVGTGPAGVSAAFPLVEAGLSVLMIDAGGDDAPAPPQGEYLSLRRNDPQQWNWMVGVNHDAIRASAATSPKLRVPNLSPTFAEFNALNRVETDNFASVGSLASGGLSNAWGAGVSRFDTGELADFPLPAQALTPGYEAVARRIGISGRSVDDLSDYFGLDETSDAPPPLDPICAKIFDRYGRKRAGMSQLGLRMGMARLALLTQDKGNRLGCDHSGLCLWGCARRAIYSARYDLEMLRQRLNLTHQTGFVVDQLARTPDGWDIRTVERGTGRPHTVQGKKVVLAAGTIASSAIALRSLGLVNHPVRLLSNPTAAFVLILPEQIGRHVVPGHNMAQLMASIEGPSELGTVHCGLFAATYLPAREFVTRFPLGRATAIELWRMLMPAATVGNCFLPGGHSAHSLTLLPDGGIRIQGGAHDSLQPTLARLGRQLAQTFRKIGAILPPGGFMPGAPGSDIHYAGTLPMTANGPPGTSRPDGELVGLPGVYIADAAALPVLPAKPHTLTMMANAHRIGTEITRHSR